MNVLLATIFILSPVTFGNLSGLFSLSPGNPACIKRFQIDPSWEVSETFTVSIKIYNGVNVYGWQANVLFDPNKLVVLEVTAGDFLAKNSIVIDSVSGEISGQQPHDVKSGDAILCYATDIRPNKVLIFGCCWGYVPGASGTGTVATITFGVWSHTQEPFYIDLGDPILVDKQSTKMSEGWLAIEWN